MKKLNNRIKVLRAEKEISQDTLAKAVEVSRQTIVAIEGKDYSPSIVLALKIAEYFDKNVNEVFSLSH
ncbi:MAG: helix-turn-helix transcriptional regulator [Elusimicrobiales bacterium]|nr:helix-turn-helix transcriptional regulator [Elusimicrobiales bacterium]